MGTLFCFSLLPYMYQEQKWQTNSTCYTFDEHIWGMNVHTYTTHEITDINHVNMSTVHMLCKLHFMLLAYITEKYGYHIASYFQKQLQSPNCIAIHTCEVCDVQIQRMYVHIHATNEVSGNNFVTRRTVHLQN